MYYWTVEFEDPRVYHMREDCPDGMKIATDNRVQIDTTPAGRVPCDTCRDLQAGR